MITVTKLFELLHMAGLVDRIYTTREVAAGKGPKGWSNETYGKKSMLYFYSQKGSNVLEMVKSLLRVNNVKFGTEWNGGNGLEIPVSYFKGNNWDD